MKRCWTGHQQGSTLLELVISLPILLLLLSAIIPLLSVSIQAWQTGRSRADIQQTSRLAIERLSNSIRYAHNITVQDNGGSLLIKAGDGRNHKFSVSPVTHALCQTIGNGKPLPFAGDGFGTTAGRVIIIANPDNQARFTMQEVPVKDKNGQLVYRIKQVKIVITVRDRSTGIEYTLKTAVVSLNS
ncbi:MAG: hypothetical protein ACRDBM_04025 [Sporomusa sp.]